MKNPGIVRLIPGWRGRSFILSMMKRIFIAIPLEKDFLKGIAGYRDSIGKKTPYLRWIPVSNLHVTVLFLGNVADTVIPSCLETVARVAHDVGPFDVMAPRAIYAPPHYPASMVWLTFRESSAFRNLCAAMRGAMVLMAGAHPDGFPDVNLWGEKEDIPHVTLARFRLGVLPPKPLVRLGKTGSESTVLSAHSLVLMESRTTPSGSLYALLGETPLLGT